MQPQHTQNLSAEKLESDEVPEFKKFSEKFHSSDIRPLISNVKHFQTLWWLFTRTMNTFPRTWNSKGKNSRIYMCKKLQDCVTYWLPIDSRVHVLSREKYFKKKSYFLIRIPLVKFCFVTNYTLFRYTTTSRQFNIIIIDTCGDILLEVLLNEFLEDVVLSLHVFF